MTAPPAVRRLRRAARRLRARLQPQAWSVRDRLALFSAAATLIVLALLALLLAGQLRSLRLHEQAQQALALAQAVDTAMFTLLDERDTAQAADASPRRGAARAAVDGAVRALQQALAERPALAEGLGDDAAAVDALPRYLQRLRTRIDQAAIRADTAGELHAVALRQLLRLAGRLEERFVLPALGAQAASLLGLAQLADEYAAQAGLLRRLHGQAQAATALPDDRLLQPLLDGVRRGDTLLQDLLAHRLPAVAAGAHAVEQLPAQRTLRDFTDPLALGSWSVGQRPDWAALEDAADQRTRFVQALRTQATARALAHAGRQLEATRGAIATAAALAALMVAFMALAFWRLYRSIAGPLQAIAQAARRTVAGDFGTRVAHTRRDELGQVAGALASLIDTLAQVDAELRRTRASVAAGDLTARADASAFGGAWRTLVERFNETLGEFAGMHRFYHHQAFHHVGSGLPNRLGLAQRLAEHGPPDRPCHVFLLLLVRIEELGLTLGSDFAAGLVRSLAGELVGRFGGRCVIAQVSTREFALVDFGPGDGPALHARAAEIVQACDQPIAHGESLVSTPGRVGVASGTVGELTALLGHASVAARRAARRMRPGYVVHDEAYRRQREAARRIELALPQAISRQAMTLVYQPVVDARDGRITAFEALMRWPLPGGGQVVPGDFIAIAEETGHILALGEMALRSACTSFMQPQALAAFGHARVSVNVSPRQLADADFVAGVRAVLAMSGLPAQRLALEITESAVMDDTEACIERIAALRAMGVAVYLDDFGTGYSSLSYLARLPVDVLKIDQSFVRGRSGDAANRRVVGSMVSLARSMGIEPLAEGVECEAERDWLVALGCVRHQGYLYARPAPLEVHLAAAGCAAGA